VALAILFFLGAISAEAETIDELQKQIGSKNDEIRRLEEEAAKFRKEIGVSQERQKTLKAELTRIDNLLAGLRRDIAITQQKIERASLEIVAFSIEISEKEDSIKTLRSGIAGLIESLRERSVESPLFIFVKYWRLSDFFSQLESIEIVSDRIFGFLTEVKERATERKDRQDTREWHAVLVFAGNLGFAVAFPIVAGVAGGAYLDRRFSSAPILTLSFMFLGVVVGFWSIIRLVRTK